VNDKFKSMEQEPERIMGEQALRTTKIYKY
jgi:hypothetical protein